MLRDVLVALAVVVLVSICATTLPLVIPHGPTHAILGVAISFGVVAVVLRETEMLKFLAITSVAIWLCIAVLGIDPQAGGIVALTVGGVIQRIWSSRKTPVAESDAQTDP